MRTPPIEAFILSAGKGTRLRPYTDTMPKPMVNVWGKPILEHTVEKLHKNGVSKIIMNIFYLGDSIKNHFSNYKQPTIEFSEEEQLLDTGGGLKYARPMLSGEPLYLINGDAFWTDGKNETTLTRLSNNWDANKMDILLLLQPVDKMTLTAGVGDYDIDEKGRAIRSLDKTGAFMFGGIRITKPDLVYDIEADKFSFLQIMDTAEKKGTLYGLIHDGEWHHISTPTDLDNVNAAQPTIQSQHTRA